MRTSLSTLALACALLLAVAARAATDDDASRSVLASATMKLFADGLKAADMRELHAAAAPSFREGNTPASTLAAFKALSDAKVDFTSLEQLQPTFTNELRRGRTLTLDGYYATTPLRAYFSFHYEGGDGVWKLTGLSVRAIPVVRASTMRHNAGWFVTLDVLDPAREIFYEVPGGKFESTGQSDRRDPRTGDAVANTSIPLVELPKSMRVKIVTRNGTVGPVTLNFDSESEIVRQDIARLEMLPGDWALLREYPEGRELLYFTSLVSSRCGIAKVRYSLGSEKLDREYPLPPCDLKNPGTIPDDMEIVTLDRRYEYVAVQLEYRDGKHSKISKIAHPGGEE